MPSTDRDRQGRRAAGVALGLMAVTLLLGRCAPDPAGAFLPGLATPAGSPSGTGHGSGGTIPLPSGDGEGGPNPDDTAGTTSPDRPTTTTDGELPEEDPRPGGSSSTTEPPASVDPDEQAQWFCVHLGQFVQPISQLDPARVGDVPSAVRKEVERLRAGLVDDPQFERNGGSADMLAIWRWAAEACVEPMAGQPARLRLIQFEDQLAGQQPVDVCRTLDDRVVEEAFEGLAEAPEVRSAEPGRGYGETQCTIEVEVGRGDATLTVTVRDGWGELEGRCVEREGTRVQDLPEADRACRLESRPSGDWLLVAEHRSRTVLIDLDWPILDEPAPGDGTVRRALEALHAAIAPVAVLGKRAGG